MHVTQPRWCSMLLPSPFFHVLMSLVFFTVPVSFDLFRIFLYDRNICTLSFDPLFLTICEFQVWDWRCYPFTCLCSQRRSVVRMEQKSQSKFLPWPGFNLGVWLRVSVDRCAPPWPTPLSI